MDVLRDTGQRLAIAAEIMAFLWHRKMWWMMPLVFVLLMMGILIIFGAATGVGPFVYTLF